MKIEIWSDIVCPFCFIGKHKLEKALEKFPDEKFEIIWKSFQLNPDEVTNPDLDATQYLAERKGWTMEYTQQTHEHVCSMGESCNIGFSFDKVKVANSLDAHRLLHLAKTMGKQNELKEKLFKAHFEDGKNIGDANLLLDIALETGIDSSEIDAVLNSNKFSEDVKQDIQEASSLGISGVPFFVFERKYAISGAQDINSFINTISTVIKEVK